MTPAGSDTNDNPRVGSAAGTDAGTQGDKGPNGSTSLEHLQAPLKRGIERVSPWLPLISIPISILSLTISSLAFFQSRTVLQRDTRDKVELLLDQAWEQLSASQGVSSPEKSVSKRHVEKAEKLVDQAARLDDDYPRVLLMRGLCSSAKGNSERAKEFYEMALRVDPSYAPAHVNLGHALFDEGDIAGGINSLEKALELDKDSVSALLNLGVMRYRLGQPQEAQKSFEKVIALDRFSQLGHYYLGNVLYSERDLAGAIKMYERARDIDPEEMPIIYVALGSALFQQGDYATAATNLEKAVAQGNSDPRVRDLLAEALVRQGRSAEAQEVRQQVP